MASRPAFKQEDSLNGAPAYEMKGMTVDGKQHANEPLSPLAHDTPESERFQMTHEDHQDSEKQS